MKFEDGNFAACFASFDSVSYTELYALAVTNWACVATSRDSKLTLALIESPMYKILGGGFCVLHELFPAGVLGGGGPEEEGCEGLSFGELVLDEEPEGGDDWDGVELASENDLGSGTLVFFEGMRGSWAVLELSFPANSNSVERGITTGGSEFREELSENTDLISFNSGANTC